MERTLVTSAENDAPDCLLDMIERCGIAIAVDRWEQHRWEDGNRDIHYGE